MNIPEFSYRSKAYLKKDRTKWKIRLKKYLKGERVLNKSLNISYYKSFY